jgi:hypothetical protein
MSERFVEDGRLRLSGRYGRPIGPGVPVGERRATTAQTAAVSLHERPHDPAVADSRSGTSTANPKPLLSSAMVLVSTAITYPHPLAGPQVSAPAVRPARFRLAKLPPVFLTNLEPAPPGFCVCAGHRPVAAEPDDRQNGGTLDTPTGYIKRASDRRFRWSEALSSIRWQVKDSNLRSFRDGFTVHSHWPLGQPAVVRMEG